MSTQLHLVRPRHVNRSVLVRPPNSELRTREYLTPAEVEKLIKEARQGRYGHRDATLILIGFRHGLRASVTHFEGSSEVIDGKAMIVCMSRDICMGLYDAIIALRNGSHADEDELGSIKVVMDANVGKSVPAKASKHTPPALSGPRNMAARKRAAINWQSVSRTTTTR